MKLSEDPTIREQLDYYRARAAEYDQWWLRQGRYDRGSTDNGHWFDESAAVLSALEQFRPTGRILELACGTGIWSQKLLPCASQLTLVDGSREMLQLAAHRLQSPDVRCIEANLFDWRPQERFDTVFFSFWLSHVPPERFAAFWNLVHDCLAPGGRVFFVDSRHEHTSTATDHRLPDRAAIQLQRRLNDGREFRIYKVFHQPHELQARLRELGWDIQVNATARYFIHGQGQRGGNGAIQTSRLDLIPMTPAFLRASLAGDRAGAEAHLGITLPAVWPGDLSSLLALRLGQLEEDPALQPWLLRAIALRETREMVGFIGFHTAPGAAYLQSWRPAGVEFGFTVFAHQRRNGYAREAATALMQWARDHHGVASFVVSISPGNQASQALAAGLGFVRIGGHVDEADGPEDVLALDVGPVA